MAVVEQIPTVERAKPAAHSTPSTLDTDATAQALAQEQALFDRKMEEHDALFRLQLAMGWSTFLLVPATVIAVIVYPPAAAGMVPLTGVAAWNWRRMLRRDGGEIEVTTKLSDKSR